jgi:hypothetical protein
MRGRVRVVAATLPLAVALFGCGRGTPESQVLRVQEAVFRHQVSYWLADHARESGVVVCLGTAEGALTRGVGGSLLARLGDRSATRSADDCVASPEGAVERSTSRPAIIVVVAGLSWRSRSEAVVDVKHYRTAAISGRRKYRVVREGDTWVCLGQVVDMTPA